MSLLGMKSCILRQYFIPYIMHSRISSNDDYEFTLRSLTHSPTHTSRVISETWLSYEENFHAPKGIDKNMTEKFYNPHIHRMNINYYFYRSHSAYYHNVDLDLCDLDRRRKCFKYLWFLSSLSPLDCLTVATREDSSPHLVTKLLMRHAESFFFL